MNCDFIVEDDDTATSATLSGWEAVVFELGEAAEEARGGRGDATDSVAEGIEELIVARYF